MFVADATKTMQHVHTPAPESTSIPRTIVHVDTAVVATPTLVTITNNGVAFLTTTTSVVAHTVPGVGAEVQF